jgi:hypothetical protein
MRALKAHIKELTGHEPPTCPWRVFYDPLVDEVIRVATLASNNLGMSALGADPIGIVEDALVVYFAARAATRAYDDEQRRKQNAQRK